LSGPAVDDLHPEDLKLVRLARAAWSRVGAAEGAAVRDLDGRTYAAATVSLGSLRLSALQLAVATAVSSGAAGLEAAAVVTRGPAQDDGAPRDAVVPGGAGMAAVADLGGADVPVLFAGPDGVVRERRRT
jgi:hypothetical protein